MEKENRLGEEIKLVSLGMLNTVIDLGLFLFASWAQSYAVGSGRKDFFKALEDSYKFTKLVRKKSFFNGLYNATRKGLLEKSNKGWELTELGRKRIESIVPQYHCFREWNRKIYLVTYDIPEVRRKDRELVRRFLKDIGCGMLQASVWITPYDPKEALKKFIDEHMLSGFIVVSDIGKDGNIGQVSIHELVNQVYKLDKLRERYRVFMQKAQKGELTVLESKFVFLSILKDDPQLPFSLLPKHWEGDKAYKLFQSLV